MAKIVVANMKSVLTKSQIEDYVYALGNKAFNNINLIVCPSYLYLNYFNNKKYYIGAQNVYFDSNNICTGEITATQLINMGVQYVIVGHSERREVFLETNEIINRKIITCLNENLKVIICIGENSKEIDMDEILLILKKQIISALKGVTKNKIGNIIIAYEPSYAIGNGDTPDSYKINKVINYIKNIIFDKYNCECSVIYGGSVNKNNINEIINICDGIMVGKLCFNHEKFLDLIKNI